MHLVNSAKWEMRGHHPGVPMQTHAHDPEAQRETALEIYFWKDQIQSEFTRKNQNLVHHIVLTFHKKVKQVII